MERRTQILALLLATVVVVAFYGESIMGFANAFLNLDEEIARKRTELIEEEKALKEYDDTLVDYKRLIERVGDLKANSVRDELVVKLEDLQFKHGLKEPSLVARPPNEDRKTKHYTITVLISGEANYERAMAFLKDLYELPQLIQISDPRFRPIEPSREQPQEDRVRLSVRVDARVLNPQNIPRDDRQKLNLDPTQFDTPESEMRHAGLDLTTVLARRPFMEYVPPKPVTRPPPRQPTVKTPVTRPPVVQKIDWPGRWTLLQTYRVSAPQARHKAVVQETGRNQTKIVTDGTDFDGGTLLHVSPKGALVRREDGDWVYPLGNPFATKIKIRDAQTFPDGFRELRRAYEGLPQGESANKG